MDGCIMGVQWVSLLAYGLMTTPQSDWVIQSNFDRSALITQRYTKRIDFHILSIYPATNLNNVQLSSIATLQIY